eukprot:CAMPEP_0197406862 /NCGR_PEP_ID=MMETSP1165-20131217/26306_1 /TAXON_ID=284809 /ORGANISM="Chrysocystis fragilis, Strain CCMP3189" /LENGTH=284 /DNA_ID=CAMNT_0042933225 /DNA_START=54 /DNA_END=905 /DNA_ORIENTATION=+
MAAFRGLSSSSSESSSDESLSQGSVARRKKARTAASSDARAVSLLDAAFSEEAVSESSSEESLFEPSDVEAALQSLRPRDPPFVVLQHTIYSIVSDRTLADRQVETLARAGKVRVLQLPSGSDDVGIVAADDWRREIENRCEPSLAARFSRFSLRTTDLYVGRRQLGDGVDALCAAGLLRPRRDAPGGDCFWFACPAYGSFAKRLQKGRAVLRKALREARHHEINIDKPNREKKSTAALLALDDPAHPDYCHGGLSFFVNDCLGRHLATLHTMSAGRFLRLNAT